MSASPRTFISLAVCALVAWGHALGAAFYRQPEVAAEHRSTALPQKQAAPRPPIKEGRFATAYSVFQACCSALNYAESS